MPKTRHRPQSARPKKGARPKTEGQVRIIAGHWRGRRLKFPLVADLRPTGDRIRETLFNWLQPTLAGANCLDLFAGSGALGFEAASRGANHVTLIEAHSDAAAALRNNLQALTATDSNDPDSPADINIVHGEALNWLTQHHDTQTFDIVFLDPPFSMDGIDQLASTLESARLLAKECWIYFESGTQGARPRPPTNWSCHREKIAGGVCYQLYRRS